MFIFALERGWQVLVRNEAAGAFQPFGPTAVNRCALEGGR